MPKANAQGFPAIAPLMTGRPFTAAAVARQLWPAGLGVAVTWTLWTLPAGLAPDARIALIVTALALIGWVGTRLPESLVALAAALALVLTGAVPEERLYAALGSDLVWLLLAAFIIAAVLKEAGLAERLVSPPDRRAPAICGLCLCSGGGCGAYCVSAAVNLR